MMDIKNEGLELKKIFISTCPLTVSFRKSLQLQLIIPSIPAPFRTYYGALCFHNGISPSKWCPEPPRQPLQSPPASPRGQGLHPIDLKSCCEGTQISREKPELTKGSESPGWWLKPQPPLVQICASQNGNPSSPKFRGVFLPPPGFFFTPEN